jgi:hypothetical protein
VRPFSGALRPLPGLRSQYTLVVLCLATVKIVAEGSGSRTSPGWSAWPRALPLAATVAAGRYSRRTMAPPIERTILFLLEPHSYKNVPEETGDEASPADYAAIREQCFAWNPSLRLGPCTTVQAGTASSRVVAPALARHKMTLSEQEQQQRQP